MRQSLPRYVLSSSKTRLLVHAGALSYFAYIATNPPRHVPCYVTVEGATGSPSQQGASAATSTMTCFVYESAEGMQLFMHDEMPRWNALAHAAVGTTLLSLVIAQAESVWCIRFSRRRHRSNQRSDTPTAKRRGVELAGKHSRRRRPSQSVLLPSTADTRRGVMPYSPLLPSRASAAWWPAACRCDRTACSPPVWRAGAPVCQTSRLPCLSLQLRGTGWRRQPAFPARRRRVSRTRWLEGYSSRPSSLSCSSACFWQHLPEPRRGQGSAAAAAVVEREGVL